VHSLSEKEADCMIPLLDTPADDKSVLGRTDIVSVIGAGVTAVNVRQQCTQVQIVILVLPATRAAPMSHSIVLKHNGKAGCLVQ
jgi:hypothetical protein